MFYTTAVRVVSEGSNEPIPNVRVSLFDKDLVSPDDLLGTAETAEDGEAHFRFTTDDFARDEDALDIREFPELYAVVYGPDGSQIASTRDQALDNRPRRHITVTVPMQAARELGWVADGG